MLRAFLAPSRIVSSAEAAPVDLVRFGCYLSACQAVLEGAPVRGHNTSTSNRPRDADEPNKAPLLALWQAPHVTDFGQRLLVGSLRSIHVVAGRDCWADSEVRGGGGVARGCASFGTTGWRRAHNSDRWPGCLTPATNWVKCLQGSRSLWGRLL
jgi:hypothetical protein